MNLWEIKIGRWRPVYSIGLFYLRHSPFSVFKEYLRHGVVGHTSHDVYFTNKDGITFHLDAWGCEQKGIFCFHYCGVEDVAAYRKFIKPADVVFDVGANIGQYSLLASLLVEKTGCVYAFEPDTEVLQKLRENIGLNTSNNIHVVPKAVASKSERMQFYPASEEKDQDIGSLLPAKGTRSNASVEVEAISLDDFCDANSIDHVDFLKIDAEGFDLEVLKGASRLIDRNPNLIVMAEIAPHLLKLAHASPTDLYSFMKERGFKPWIAARRGKLRPLRIEKSPRLLNVFFLPENKV